MSGRVMISGAVLLAVVAGIAGWLILSKVEMKDNTEIFAHRGSSNIAPENTLAAVDQAINDGAHWTEIDVQRTIDDKVVVVHDRDLMRIGGKPIVIANASYSELANVDIGSWFDPAFADQRIPTLEKVLGHCKGRIKVNIELKYYGWDEKLAKRVIGIVEKKKMVEDVVIMSLKLEAVDQVKKARPGWKTGLLTAASFGNLTRTNADFLAVHSRMVTPGFLNRVHRAGKDVLVWTVNDRSGMTKYFSMNVDGLITDEPALAVNLLEQRAGMDPIEKALISLGLLIVGESEHVDPMTDGL
jgi:glycerophosphoryl diester phosphodiesterase